MIVTGDIWVLSVCQFLSMSDLIIKYLQFLDEKTGDLELPVAAQISI